MTVVRDQLFPQKPPGSRLRFSRTGVQPSPGSSTIELPSAFTESDAYPLDRELPGSPRLCSLPLACRHPSESHQIGARKRRTPENTIFTQPYCRRVSTDRPNREDSQSTASLEGEPGPTPAGKTLPHHTPKPGFGGRGVSTNDVWKAIDKYVCAVCVFSSHLFWTSSSLDIPAGVRQEEGHIGFLIHLPSAVRALIFLARRIQPFLSLVGREVEFCVLTISSFSTCWAFFFFFLPLFSEKTPIYRDLNSRPNVSEGYEVMHTSKLPGRPTTRQKQKAPS